MDTPAGIYSASRNLTPEQADFVLAWLTALARALAV
jgi:hypothetical protein